MDKRYYYIGEGVFHHKGKDYGYGEALPADVPEASIESMLTKKKVSETKPAGTAGAGTADDNAPLKDEIQRLKAQVIGLQDTVMEDIKKAEKAESEIQRLQGELDGARATITEKDATIKSLTDQLMGAGKGGKKG